MIMAAGRGERMRHLTDDTPKPMLQVADRPLIDWVIDRLQAFGIERVVVNASYLGEQIIDHLDNRDEAEFITVAEPERLETGGGVYNAREHLGDDPFFVINADTLWLDGPSPLLERMAELWVPGEMDALLMVQPTVRVFGDYEGRGDFEMAPDGRLIRRQDWNIAPFVYGGVQLVSPSLITDPPAESFSFNRFWDRAIEDERLFGMSHDGVWFHVGTPEGLDLADEQLAPERARWLDPLHMV
ncbi:MAG: nucleotidyltransferase family protein [Alphaproteobacteria bacterium]|nr:nucleotidyltransferase family protein [Alphaproteobacteria bacterium SS10]